MLGEPFVQVVAANRLHVVDQGAVLGRPVRDSGWAPPPAGLLDAMIGVRAREPGERDELLDACARQFAAVVRPRGETTEHRCWLVIVSGTPDADSRLRRHVGLRRERERLQERLHVPSNAWGEDLTLTTGEQLRFANALEVSWLEPAAVDVCDERLTHMMIFTERDLRDAAALEALLDIAWPSLKAKPDSLPCWSRLLTACSDGDVPARPVGNFDDLERRLDLVGTEDALRSILTGQGLQALQALSGNRDTK
jgi:hypothetical protein